MMGVWEGEKHHGTAGVLSRIFPLPFLSPFSLVSFTQLQHWVFWRFGDGDGDGNCSKVISAWRARAFVLMGGASALFC